jgi:hypothetical protein
MPISEPDARKLAVTMLGIFPSGNDAVGTPISELAAK